MKSSEALFQLIQSLTQGEKWHFRSYSSKQRDHGEKKYIRLFDAIDRQKAYDEATLKKRFSPQFASAKNYLYNLVLESLEVYHADKTQGRQIQQLLHRAEILLRKDLYIQADKLLRKAYKMADANELPLQAIESIQRQQQYIMIMNPLQRSATKLLEMGKQEDELIDNYKHAVGYNRLARLMSVEQNQVGNIRTKADLKRFDYIYKHPLMLDKSLAKNRAAKVYYHMIKASEHWIKRELKEARQHYAELLELIEAQAAKEAKSRENYINLYTAHLENYLEFSIELGAYDKAFYDKLETLHALFKEKGLSQPMRDYLFVRICVVELSRSISSGDYRPGLAIIKELEQNLPRYGQRPGDWGSLNEIYLMISLLYLYIDEYGKALKWLHKLQNSPHVNEQQTLTGAAKMLAVIVNLQLGNERLMEYHVRSLYRYLTKLARPYKTEKMLLRFLQRELPRVQSEKQLNAALKKLRAALNALENDPFERNEFARNLVINWIDSRLQKRPMADVVRDKATK